MADTHETSPATPNPVRPPNATELQQLWGWLTETERAEIYMLEQATWFLQFQIAVFDEYQTGCPGYCGRVLYLVWDGAPDYCDVFTWDRKGHLVHESSHADCDSR
jgi:hypothetical protein